MALLKQNPPTEPVQNPRLGIRSDRKAFQLHTEDGVIPALDRSSGARALYAAHGRRWA